MPQMANQPANTSGQSLLSSCCGCVLSLQDAQMQLLMVACIGRISGCTSRIHRQAATAGKTHNNSTHTLQCSTSLFALCSDVDLSGSTTENADDTSRTRKAAPNVLCMLARLGKQGSKPPTAGTAYSIHSAVHNKPQPLCQNMASTCQQFDRRAHTPHTHTQSHLSSLPAYVPAATLSSQAMLLHAPHTALAATCAGLI